MSAKLNIKYVVDSLEGTSLSTTLTGTENGWVEHCNRHGQLYFSEGVPEDYLTQCHQQVIARIAGDYQKDDKKNMGFVHHLAGVLINDEFVLPLFGVVNNEDKLIITAGKTRLAANIINGVPANKIRLVFFVPTGKTNKQIPNAKPLTSTANFEKIYNLTDIDYEISMSDCVEGDMSEFSFDRSVLKYSIYDKKDQALPHTQVGSYVSGFWNKHRRNQKKIKINIRCTAEVEKLIQPSEIFSYDIVHEKAEEWQWSFGKILGSYRKTEEPVGYDESQLHLWLYDITEPVYLELLVPWISGQYTCMHSKNKKALLFDTSSDVTSMQVIGDWVN